MGSITIAVGATYGKYSREKQNPKRVQQFKYQPNTILNPFRVPDRRETKTVGFTYGYYCSIHFRGLTLQGKQELKKQKKQKKQKEQKKRRRQRTKETKRTPPPLRKPSPTGWPCNNPGCNAV